MVLVSASPEKDEENEIAIPMSWRPHFVEIVEAFVRGDYSLSSGIDRVAPISESTANHIERYIESYGDILTSLPNETWESSVHIWMGGHWEAMVDLWTVAEGRSDLVLSAKIFEAGNGFSIEVGMVYVP